MAEDPTLATLQRSLAETQAELARAEERIQALSDTRDAVFDNVADGVLAVDPQGHLVAINRAALRLYGYPTDLPPPQHLSELSDELEAATPAGEPLPPEELPIARALQGEAFSEREYRIRARGSECSWIAAISGAPVRDAQGNVQFAIITLRDVTEQRGAAELLEQRVAERTARLQIIHDLDRLVLASRQPAEIARAALERVLLVTGAIHASVVLFDSDAEAMDILAVLGEASEDMAAGSRRPFSDGWRIDETLAGRVVTLPDLDELPESDPAKASQVHAGMASAAYIPMAVGGSVIGAITLARREKGQLPPDLLDLLVHVADSLAIAIQNSRLIDQLVEQQAELSHANEQLRMVNEIDKAVLAARSKEEIADAALERLRCEWACDRASILLYNDERGEALVLAACQDDGQDTTAGQILPLDMLRIPPQHMEGGGHLVRDLTLEHPGEPVAEALRANGTRSHLSLPLLADGRLIGSLNLSSSTPETFDEAAMEAIQPVAASLAVAVRNAQMYQQIQESQAQLQALTRRLITVQEAERRSLARELHDQVAQSITGLSLGVAALARRPDCPPALAEKLNYYQSVVAGMMKELHAVVSALRPPGLDGAGLVTAMEQHVRALGDRYGLDAELEAEGLDDEPLPSEFETMVYRLVQEALTNVVRHSQATRVRVHLERRGDTVTATIEDDGVGFDLHEAGNRGRLGLIGMRERAAMIGGRVAFDSAPGRGTRVTVTAPVPE